MLLLLTTDKILHVRLINVPEAETGTNFSIQTERRHENMDISERLLELKSCFLTRWTDWFHL